MAVLKQKWHILLEAELRVFLVLAVETQGKNQVGAKAQGPRFIYVA